MGLEDSHRYHAPEVTVPGCEACCDRASHVKALLALAKEGKGPLAAPVPFDADALLNGKPPKEHEIAKAVRQTIHDLTADDKPLTVDQARKIGRLVGSAVKLLQATSDRVLDLLPAMPRPAMFGGMGMAAYPSAPPAEDWDGEEPGAPGPLAYAPPVETFGSQALREITAAIPKILEKKNEPTVKDMVESIKVAKEAGLTDVAASLKEKLERKLGGGKPSMIGQAQDGRFKLEPPETYEGRVGLAFAEAFDPTRLSAEPDAATLPEGGGGP